MSNRIKYTQNNVQELMRPQPHYLVTASEFHELHRYMARMLNRRKKTAIEHRSYPAPAPKGSTHPIEDRDGSDRRPSHSETPALKSLERLLDCTEARFEPSWENTCEGRTTQFLRR